MQRRRFLRGGLTAAVTAVGAGGFLFFRRNNARAELNNRLLVDALPLLSSDSTRQLQTLPVRCREEIKRYFHGKCLNVHNFVTYICSDSFGERLGRCNTVEERQDCLLVAFCDRVATESEILNQVDVIATEVGSELDTEWGVYCRELSTRWNITISGYGRTLTADTLNNNVSGIIQTEIERAIRLANTANQSIALSQTIGCIGKSALLLLPRVRSSSDSSIVFFVFFVQAAADVLNYVLSRLENKKGEYQLAISDRLALLGNRVGAEFEREVRQRLSDLHTWQERSVRDMANNMVQERIGLF